MVTVRLNYRFGGFECPDRGKITIAPDHRRSREASLGRWSPAYRALDCAAMTETWL